MRLLIGTLVLGFTFGGLALAQDRQDPNRGRQGGRQGDDRGAPRFDAQRFLKDHDRNNDGQLTKEELPQRMQEGFQEIDANKDNKLSAQELQQHSEKMARQRPAIVHVLFYAVDFPDDDTLTMKELQEAYDFLRKLDKDNNGKIQAEDVKTFREQRRKERTEMIIKELDRNNDGKVGKDEARGLWQDNFGQLDKNNDGSLDQQEIQDAFTPRRQPGQDDRPGAREKKGG